MFSFFEYHAKYKLLHILLTAHCIVSVYIVNYYISTYYIQSMLKSKGDFVCATMGLYTYTYTKSLQKKVSPKTKSVKIWIFLAVTSTDTVEMNFREWTPT